MQGRLQGKRLHGRYFLDVVARARHRGLQLPARRRRRHEHRRRLRDHLVGARATATWSSSSTSTRIRLLPHLPATAMVQCDLVWPDHAPVAPVTPGRSSSSSWTAPPTRGYVALAGTELEFIVFDDTYEDGLGRRLPRTSRPQPVQRRLLDPRHDPGRAAAARHPQHDVRRGHERRGRQGRVQPRAARDRLPLRRGADHRRQPRGLQDRRQGDRRAARQVAHVHGEVQRARGQLLPHPPVAARRRRRLPCSGTTRPGRARRSTTSSSPACSPRCPTSRCSTRRTSTPTSGSRTGSFAPDDDRLGAGQPHLRRPAGRARAAAPGWRTGCPAAT